MKIPINNLGQDLISSIQASQIVKDRNTLPDHKESLFHKTLQANLQQNENKHSNKTSPLDKVQIQQFIGQLQMQTYRSLLSSISDEKEETTPDLSPISEQILPPYMNMDSTEQPATSKKTANVNFRTQILQPPADVKEIISQAANDFNLDPHLIASIVKTESNFDQDSVSPKGAMGLMQLMPKTAEELGVQNPYNPKENIIAGSRYLKSLLDKYDGNLKLSLAAYNWGMGNVDRHTDSLPNETKEYIERVMSYYQAPK
ncbi:MAG: lytic transglycosylase domain-containing protein [Desulfobacterales bacterium]|nr:lytic transglycosylase domain-containing protein [Desulfobacterales bacterium]